MLHRVIGMARAVDAGLEERFERERDQLPLCLPVGLGLGIAAWFTLPDVRGWSAFPLICLACALLALGVAGGTRWGRALAVFSLAASLGCALVWMRAETTGSAPLPRPGMHAFEARILSVRPMPAQEMTRILVEPLSQLGLPHRLRVNVAQDKWDARVTPGARVQLRAWLMPPAPMAVPGSYDFSRVAWFQGLGGTGKALDLRILEASVDRGWRASLAGWRQRLSDHIRTRLADGEGGIAAALATGDQGGISDEDAEAMRASGLAHLLSVSGLHLTAVVGAVMLVSLRILALSPALALRLPLLVIAAGIGAVAGIAYTLLTGAEVPTIRSCIAAVLILLGIALGREALTLRLVAAGALVVLLLWPEALVGPSFQLSFAAITAIVALHEHPRIVALLGRRDEGLIQRFGRALLGLVLTGLAVEIALSPIALYHFHKAGLYGAFANIVAIPLTTFVVMPLEALALLADLLGLGAPFWWMTGAALRLLLGIAHWTAAAPGAVATVPAMPVPAFGLMVAGGLWLLIWRTRWRRLGVIPFAIGGIWAAATPAPDLVVTGDGRHLALRTDGGGYALLRNRAGDYVRDLLGGSAGSDDALADLDAVPGTRCNADLCMAEVHRGGRRWRLIATRSGLRIPADALARACRDADIVVSERRLPKSCRPAWLKADRALLQRTGGLSIVLGPRPHVETVADRVGAHPWAQAARAPFR